MYLHWIDGKQLVNRSGGKDKCLPYMPILHLCGPFVLKLVLKDILMSLDTTYYSQTQGDLIFLIDPSSSSFVFYFWLHHLHMNGFDFYIFVTLAKSIHLSKQLYGLVIKWKTKKEYT